MVGNVVQDQTYKSIVVATRESKQDTLVAEAGYVDKQAIGALWEGSSVLDATLGDVPVDGVWASLFAILQAVDCVVAVSREGNFQQALEVQSFNLVAPPFCREVVEMSTKVPPPAQRADTETCTLGSSLDALAVLLSVFAR